MKFRKLYLDFSIILPIIVFAVISILSIYSSESIIGDGGNYASRQFNWYLISVFVIAIIYAINNKKILKYTWLLYGTGVLLLVLLLIFGKPINNSKCWFEIPGFGAFQPSEFMKIILILTLSRMIEDFRNKYNKPTIWQEFVFLVKVLIVVAIPSLLTFLQPDTGVVLIYLLITFIMLFIAGIRIGWFILVFTIIGGLLGCFLWLYFIEQELFISIFGTDFFLRIDRLLDWSKLSGYQLENGMTAIGAGGWNGRGINNTPIYFPEPQTDFIFAVFASNFGFLGAMGLFLLLIFFDIRLIILAYQTKDMRSKLIIGGMVAMLIYQQFQNIGMTYGILPITGITLPFISYGGSSLLSYMIMTAIILNISRNNRVRVNYE